MSEKCDSIPYRNTTSDRMRVNRLANSTTYSMWRVTMGEKDKRLVNRSLAGTSCRNTNARTLRNLEHNVLRYYS